MKRIQSYLKLIRVKHWLKNSLIFLPLIFSNNLFNSNKLVLIILGFFSFSFMASSVYIINDIQDIEKDKLNPYKKNRPLASGVISKKYAIGVLFILVVSSVILNFMMKIEFHEILIGIAIQFFYLMMNFFYSIKLKRIPIIDVCVLSLGFILRIVYGSIISGIMISNWLYLTVMVGSFYMGFGKRKSEIEKQGINGRDVLKKYNKEFLNKFMYVCLCLAVVFYSLWAIDSETIQRIGNNYMIYTVPLIFIILMKYSYDVEEFEFGDPVDIIFKDKILLILGIIQIIFMMCILYVI